MSARVTIEQSPAQLRIEIRPDAGEVIRFAVFALIILSALYGLIPAARTAPGLLLAVGGVATGWSVAAISGREVYTVDATWGLIKVWTSSTTDRCTRFFATHEVAAVHVVTGGMHDDRCLVELVASDGTVRLQLPRRLTTLNPRDQWLIGRRLADHLGVPLRANVYPTRSVEMTAEARSPNDG